MASATAGSRSTSTSSFVTEVLATAGRLEKDDLNAKLGKLSRRIEEVKVEVHDALQKRYEDFFPNLKAGIDLSSQVKTVIKDMEDMAGKIENEVKNQLNISTTEFQDLSSQMREAHRILAYLDKLVEMYDSLEAINSAATDSNYSEATRHINSIGHILDVPVSPRDTEIHILTELQKTYFVRKDRLLHDIEEVWCKMVKWILPKDVTDGGKEGQAMIVIASGKDQKAILTNTAQAMDDLKILEPKLKQLATRLFDYVLKPIVINGSAMVKSNMSTNPAKLIIIGNKSIHEPVGPQVVFTKIDEVFQFLDEHLLGITVYDKSDSDDSSSLSRVPLMKRFGQLLAPDLLEFLIKECLAHSIPSSNKDLEKFNSVISKTGIFEHVLVKFQFINPDNHTLVDYVKNVNILFANKKCQELLQKARKLMVSEIHNSVEISNNAPLGDLPPLGGRIPGGDSGPEKIKSENHSLATDQKLSPSTYCLPTCHISSSVQTLVHLAYESLHEATNSNPQCAVQMFYSVRNMFQLFCDVVPTYHRNILTRLPQLSAIHHNNCMYLAHHLLTMGHQFRPKLPEPLSVGGSTFVDLVPQLRRLGTECFLAQMTAQKSQLMEYLAEAQGFVSVSEVANFSAADRALKQCLHQLVHLGNVWRPVLPVNLYNKAMGTLVNSMITELINGIVSLEDISADDATQLHLLMHTVTEKAPLLFTSDGDKGDAGPPVALMHQHVPKWLKYKELMLVLNAGLQDIADRWADGKGPLAHEFSGNEIKQLVRALFQNTERRAAVLNKIR